METQSLEDVWATKVPTDELNDELMDEMVELPLYNQNRTFSQNFEDSAHSKFILIKVKNNGGLEVVENTRENFPMNCFDKIVVSMEEYDNHDFESIMVDYDSLFGMRFLSFMQYNPNFFDCQERVFFEALLIKFRKSHFTSFYWSKTVIAKELGIKPDKAKSIIKRFTDLGIINSEVRKSFNKTEKRSQQVTFFSLNADRIAELLPDIFDQDDEDYCKEDIYLKRDLKKYLQPALSKPLESFRKEEIKSDWLDIADAGNRISLSNTMQ